MRLRLIRRGEYVEVLDEDTLRDRADRAGSRQATLPADRLAAEPVDVLLSSPMRRARESADLVAGRLGVPVLYEPDLAEWRADEPGPITRGHGGVVSASFVLFSGLDRTRLRRSTWTWTSRRSPSGLAAPRPRQRRRAPADLTIGLPTPDGPFRGCSRPGRRG
jgi:hypothetical protein